MNAKFIGPVKDYSGYGEACRHDVGALHAADIKLTLEIPQYTLELADFGKLGELSMSFEARVLDYKYVIMHVTPNVYPQYVSSDNYNIGRVFWETDKLPFEFAKPCELLDEIWTGSEFNAQAIRNAGVTKPIYIIPEAIDGSLDITQIEPYIISNDKDFRFYSIFEWTERKDPAKLLTAFWTEFENEENVSLTLKVYVDNFTPEKRREIQHNFDRIKNSLGLKNYAPVYFYNGLMDRHQIYRFHRTFDCLVSAHRGEGWGIPQMEAMLMERPIISTGCGGIHEYLTDGKDALLVGYKMINLRANTRNRQWYTPDQNWADADLTDLRNKMRWVFDNKKEAREMGKRGRKTVLAKFDLPVVGAMMRERLEQIEKGDL